MARPDRKENTNLSPRLKKLEALLRTTSAPFRRGFSELELMQVKGEKAKAEARDMYDQLGKYLVSDLKQTYRHEKSMVAGAGDIPDGICMIVNVSGSLVNLSRGRDEVRVSIAYLENGVAQSAAIYNPLNDEMIFAERGAGVKGRFRYRVTDREEIEDGMFGLFSPVSALEGKDDISNLFNELRSQGAHLRIGGNPILSLLEVASGKLDGFVGLNLLPHDVILADLFLKESAGVATTAKAENISVTSDSVIAAPMKLHGQLLKLLRG